MKVIGKTNVSVLDILLLTKIFLKKIIMINKNSGIRTLDDNELKNLSGGIPLAVALYAIMLGTAAVLVVGRIVLDAYQCDKH